jgi:ATP-dependent helicase/nuclease subunit A
MPDLTPHQKKALNYKDHISLTANAGSGKTFVLSKRFVEIALNENISLRSIAAITFTDKAAGDLYKKIANEIDGRIETEKEPSVRYKLENIRRQLVSANISTIHSFCIDIIREHPIEANVDANFTPVDETYSGELIEHSVEETLKEFMNSDEGNGVVKKMIRFFGSKNNLSDELARLVKNKKGILNLKERIYSGSVEQTAGFFYDSFVNLAEVTIFAQKEEVIAAISDINNTVLGYDEKNETAKEVNRQLGLAAGGASLNIFGVFFSLIMTSSSPYKVRKQKYLAEKISGGLSAQIALVEKRLPEMAKAAVPVNRHEIETELALFGGQILLLAGQALKKYDDKKRDGGYLDFEDILIITREILKNGDVREKLSQKYLYLMVDEYQDTNEIQYDIFLPILEYLTKNNLFVVGDEKQSIYMFREAELEIFERTKREIKTIEGERGLLELPDSFRMAPEICLFTNYLFSRLFEKANPVYNEVGPKDIVCGRNDGVRGSLEFLILDEEKSADGGLAGLIARRINKLAADDSSTDKISYNDIAVLCRKRSSFPALEREFSKYGVPYTILGGKGFYQKQVVKDFYNYFAFLLNPENEPALAGVLRSPFFSVDDSVLYLASLEDEYGYWKKIKKHSLKNDILKNAVEKIGQNLELKGVFDISSLFRKILNETNYIAVAAAGKNGYIELENLNKLIGLSIDFFNEGFKTLFDYVSYLKESIAFYEDEGQAEPFTGENSVKIMTIHQSKGLEFKAVFLYKTDERTKKSLVKSKSIIVDKNFGILTKVPLNGNYFDDYQAAPIVNLANHIIEKKEAAEMKRLFYVAVTRAMNRLYIAAEKGKGAFPDDSMMGLLEQALAPDFSREKYFLKAPLKVLRFNEKGYYNEEKEIELNIPIVKTVDFEKPVAPEEETAVTEIKNLSAEITDIPENEVFSATKISTYIQCPLKYRLNYEYNFNSMFGDYFNWKIGNFSAAYYAGRDRELESSKMPEVRDEEGGSFYPEVKGKIIHSVLQNNIGREALSGFIKEKLAQEVLAETGSEKEKEILTTEITKDIERYYSSSVCAELSGFEKTYNEFELYVREDNYILHGIIDKLIIDNDRALIIDYKTDNIAEKKLEERFNSYLSQLEFYSYIVNKHLKNFNKLEVRVIFIKYPEKVFARAVNKQYVEALGKKYAEIIKQIRSRIFNKNTENCKNCIYSAIGRKCIIN